MRNEGILLNSIAGAMLKVVLDRVAKKRGFVSFVRQKVRAGTQQFPIGCSEHSSEKQLLLSNGQSNVEY